jgi:hypothetical protein
MHDLQLVCNIEENYLILPLYTASLSHVSGTHTIILSKSTCGVRLLYFLYCPNTFVQELLDHVDLTCM